MGSTTITHAFHNALPLAVTGSFLPFGPTPARFDIFSLAAREALSKPGARVDLDIRLADASLLALAAPRDGEVNAAGTTAYGIDVNGLLYSLTISSSSDVSWRSDGPGDGRHRPVVLDGAAGLLAARATGVFPLDVLVARDRNGKLWYTMVFGGAFAGAWQPVPADPGADPTVDDLVLVTAPSGRARRRPPAAGRDAGSSGPARSGPPARPRRGRTCPRSAPPDPAWTSRSR